MDTTLLPTGTVTFLFTDIEGSTRLWEQHPEAMDKALARHDALLAAGHPVVRHHRSDRSMQGEQHSGRKQSLAPHRA